MQLYPDIYLLSGFAYGIHQNVYGIDVPEENKLVLIDTGLDAAELAVIRKNLAVWGLSSRRISDVFITHSHFDHTGNAHVFEEEGAVIHVGEADAEALLKGGEGTIDYCYGMDFPVCKSVDAVKISVQTNPADDDASTKCDSGIYKLNAHLSLRAVSVPGHTPGCICWILEKDGKDIAAFTGDFLQSERAGDVTPGIKVDPRYDYNAYLASAKKLSGMRDLMIFAGHYGPKLGPNNAFGDLYRELLVNRDKYL